MMLPARALSMRALPFLAALLMIAPFASAGHSLSYSYTGASAFGPNAAPAYPCSSTVRCFDWRAGEETRVHIQITDTLPINVRGIAEFRTSAGAVVSTIAFCSSSPTIVLPPAAFYVAVYVAPNGNTCSAAGIVTTGTVTVSFT